MEHTAENIAAELKKVSEEWGITDKITCIVTDNAANMKAAARLTGWKHLPCFAHTLNLIVQEATERDQELSEVRQKARSIVTYFKQSVKAKDKLDEIQLQMGGEEKKLIRDVVTRWNSSYFMYERLVEQYHAVNTALCYMDHSDLCLSPTEVEVMTTAMKLLQPFEEATREVSADKFISISKVIPLARSLQRVVATFPTSCPLKHELLGSMRRKFTNIEGNYPLAVSTLLDPRFKKVGFGDTTACNQTVQRLMTELASVINSETPTPATGSNEGTESRLWSVIDEHVAATISRPSTSSSMITLRTYLDQPNLARKEDPLRWWQLKEQSLFGLSTLSIYVRKFLSIPATSVPAERLFSKAGELMSLKRNRIKSIKSKNIDMILFLNNIL